MNPYVRFLRGELGLLRPKLTIKDLNELNVTDLLERGIKAIGLDKDNVLTLPDDNAVHPRVKDPVQELSKHFELAVFSNSIGSSKDFQPSSNRHIGNVPVVEHGTRKPLGGSLLLEHFRSRLGKNLNFAQVAFIGDRKLTDIVFANANNMFSILIEPLDQSKDSNLVQVLRKIEKYL